MANGKSVVLHDAALLAEHYRVPNPADLPKIAAKSETIIETLIEARAQIEKYFGPRPNPRLFLESDPEISGWEQVMVAVPIAEVAADMHHLSDFDDHWWIGASRHESAEICVTLDV